MVKNVYLPILGPQFDTHCMTKKQNHNMVPRDAKKVPWASTSCLGVAKSLPGAASSCPGAVQELPRSSHFHVGASEAKRSEAVLTQLVLHALILLDTFVHAFQFF